jgi:hypothetical protein
VSRFLAALAASLCVFASSAWAQLGPAPSWRLTQGLADSCSSTSGLEMPGVYINAPVPASEQGTLSAPGNPALGYTQDTSFTGVGLNSFTVFLNAPYAYALPPNTPITLSVTTFNEPNFTGGVAYVSTITWNCTTGALVNDRAAQPVPTLGHAALVLLLLALLGIGARAAARRRA